MKALKARKKYDEERSAIAAEEARKNRQAKLDAMTLEERNKFLAEEEKRARFVADTLQSSGLSNASLSKIIKEFVNHYSS